ncbi:aromatic amino acid transaminase [Pontixanthobacter aestiaquae]|uniref:Aminotransferase class I/II-fold pyridoxal phosphate-dependent enzyme n=1 Tax=Pontixanthobacter aestiaquae TaxID=1509367 RepID=A0A844Z627_9SPHN|nr:aromatic amino acid transaminase [Pontixanthobacter aestiaquae]MDN3646246.1 aromatic amino acid transaminase [Pontixanthobacter aestiaquae]MXO82762.1 aminotransferase class I/II-fold pyridoxal phosphate-dependent enzyme [Pontixanthobacter aestiaquae]
MLDRLQPQSPDALLALIKLYAADDRADKIDLGVGVYRTNEGDTPVFAAIKSAEAKLVAEQDSKSYLGPEGDTGFVRALMPYIFGSDATMGGRIEGMQTPGGTGAVRLAVAVAKQAGVTAIHMGTPSWPNHAQILSDVVIDFKPFDHANADGTANIDTVLQVIRDAQDGDAVLLHGCCHNPTGIDYSNEQWDQIADAFASSAALPILDIAYQGLGHGLEEDAYGIRKILGAVPEALVCYSCDKNFGMYRDRVGALYVMAKNGDGLAPILSNLNFLARASWSMPPDHGAAAVRVILRDSDMTKAWLDELETMRERMRRVRDRLAAAGDVGTLDLRPLGQQNGLFSVLPLSKDQIQQLRDDHAIYMAGSGRINIAGLHKGNIDKFIGALEAVTS